MLLSNRAPLAYSETDIIRELCRRSYYRFVQEFWAEAVQEDPVWNWHIPYLCNELQLMAERVEAGLPKSHDLIVNISPGTTKSTLASVMFLPWIWTIMPSFRMICGSHTHTLALDLSRKARDVVLSEKYQDTYTDVRLRDDQSTKGYWANTRGGMRYSVGVGGSVIGMHAHGIMLDDPIDPASAISEADLLTVNRWCSETVPSRKVDKLIAFMGLIMQRLHQNDPTGNMLAKAKGNVKHICLPAELGDNVYPASLRAKYVGGLMDPVRLNRVVLEEAKLDLGEYGYAGQFRQHPVPLGGGMFRVGKLEVADAPQRFDMVARYWDKAGTAAGGAYTVGVKIGKEMRGKDNPHFWILDVKRGQWAVDERERIIVNTAKADGRNVVIGVEQEPGSGGKESAEATARRLAGYRVRLDKVTGDKVTRAEPFAAQVNSGGVSLAKGGPWAEAYMQELEYFPFSTYKDQVDASSGAFVMLVKKIIAGAL